MSIRRNFSVVTNATPCVAVLTPTRRWGDPESDAYKARYHGLISLYDQFSKQHYPKDALQLRIADASPEPHPFFQNLEDPRVIYLHMPERSQALKDSLESLYPGTERFLLLDDDLKTEDMRYRISRLQSYCSRKTCPGTGEQIPSIQDPLEIPFPTIGMKRNILCALPFTGGKKPDIFVAFDDDDWRGPDYVRNCVQHLQGSNGWTKLVNYQLAIVGGRDSHISWAEKQLEPSGVYDEDGLPRGLKTSNSNAMMFVAASGFSRADPESAFNPQRWHPLSTDGAVHAFRRDAWERTVELFGGYLPISYNEDVLLFEAFRHAGRLDKGVSIARAPAIYEALTGLRTYTPEEVEADRRKGSIGINPDFNNRGNFCRLCCGNVSPVVFTDLVDSHSIPHRMKMGFAPLQHAIAESKDNKQHFDQNTPNLHL